MPLITLLKPGALVFSDPELIEKHANTIPIDYILMWFKDRIYKNGSENRILILLSSTGSGKSTALPPAIFREFISKNPSGGGIIITQPRVINAITIPKDQIARSEYYSYMKLGDNLGWQTGPSKKQPVYGLTYVTVGILIAQFKTYTDEEIMEKYKFIIIDEAHEASLELASLLYMLKNFYARNGANPKLPFLVLMSATFDAGKFIKYFLGGDDYGNGGLAAKNNFIQVSGFAYPLAERWDTINVSVVNYISAAVETVKRIHQQGMEDPVDNRDILVFMPGTGEINECISRIKTLNKTILASQASRAELLLPLVINREAVNTNSEDYRLLFADLASINSDAGDGTLNHKLLPGDATSPSNAKLKVFRRVLFGTSVLETGVTIDTLKYVCDSGYHRGPQFIANFSVGGVITVPATKSRIRQRAGRANRKSEGEFWPLYPKYIYDALEDNQLSDIETSDISSIILGILAEQIISTSNQLPSSGEENVAGIANNIIAREIDTIDKIPLDTIQYQIEKLYAVGFISPECEEGFYKLGYNEDPDYKAAKIAALKPRGVDSTFGITKLGQIAAMFNGLTPEQIKLIMSSYMWGCSTADIISIAAYMGIKYADFKASMTSDIKWVEIYRMGLPFYMTNGRLGSNQTGIGSKDETVIYRTKLIVADDFISGLLLFISIEKILKGVDGLNFLEKWCRDVGIKYSTCLEFIAARDDIIEQMLQIGLNPFYGHSFVKAHEHEFMNYIVSIKHCILDAWRLNLAKWDDNKKSYVLMNGLEIITPPMLAVDEKKLMMEKSTGVTQKYNPTFIICESPMLKIQRNKDSAATSATNVTNATMYEIKSGRVSALDGYVDPDLTT